MAFSMSYMAWRVSGKWDSEDLWKGSQERSGELGGTSDRFSQLLRLGCPKPEHSPNLGHAPSTCHNSTHISLESPIFQPLYWVLGGR